MIWKKVVALLPGLLILGTAVVALGQGAGVQAGSEPPKLRGETLDDQKIVLPDAALGKTTLLVLGFSKKGGERTGAWREHFSTDFDSNPHAAYFVAAMLQNAPAMFRGMIRSSMRAGTPAAARRHVLTSASDEAAWKAYLHVTDDSLPAVLLLDASGRALWSHNGSFDSEHYKDLKTAATTALEHY